MARRGEDGRSTPRIHLKMWAFIIIIVVVGGGLLTIGLYWTQIVKYFSAQSENPVTVSTSSVFTVTVMDNNGAILNDSLIGFYRYEKPTGFTQADLEGLVLGDYSWFKTKSTGESITPDLDTYVYLMNVNSTGYQAIERLPTLGQNNVTLAATPTASKLGGLANDLTSAINQTDQVKWDIFIRFLDAESEINTTMGYKCYTNYSAAYDSHVKNMLVIDTNATLANRNFIKSIDVLGEYTISADKIIIEIPEDWMGEKQIKLEFSSGLGSTYEIESLVHAFGTASDYSTISTMV